MKWLSQNPLRRSLSPGFARGGTYGLGSLRSRPGACPRTPGEHKIQAEPLHKPRKPL
jgi:hypothetical protein